MEIMEVNRLSLYIYICIYTVYVYMYMYAQDGAFAVGAKVTKRKCIGQIEHHLHMPWLIHRANEATMNFDELWREVSHIDV